MPQDRSPRDRFSHLLVELLAQGPAPGPQLDPAALRLWAHATLNLTHALPQGQALNALSQVLPWLGAFLQAQTPGTTPGQMAAALRQNGVVRHMGPLMLQRRLEAARELEQMQDAGEGTAVRRAPSRPDEAQTDPTLEAVVAIARLEADLGQLAAMGDGPARAHLLASPEHLAAALELAHEPHFQGQLCQRLRELFPAWRESAAPAPRAHARPWLALTELAHLEALAQSAPAEKDSPQPPRPTPVANARLQALSERSRRFEASLAANLGRHGLLEAVRAALALTPPTAGLPMGSRARQEALATSLRSVEAFAKDPALDALARALCEVRGRCLGYMQGQVPLEDLAGWLEYLTRAGATLGQSRGWTAREATGFAHYCLHLVNLCDLAALGPRSLSEATRRAMMDIEDQLKEFALMGQLQGTPDLRLALERLERARWRLPGEAAWVADRLTRLQGAWREGAEPGPMGAPPRLVAARYTENLQFVQTCPPGPLGRLAQGLRRACLVECHGLEGLQTPALAALLTGAVEAAQVRLGAQSPRLFWLDMQTLDSSPEEPTRHAAEQARLRRYLEALPPLERLLQAEGPRALDPGAWRLDDLSSPTHTCLAPRFVPQEELRALLDLAFSENPEAGELTRLARERLHALLDPRPAKGPPAPRAKELAKSSEASPASGPAVTSAVQSSRVRRKPQLTPVTAQLPAPGESALTGEQPPSVRTNASRRPAASTPDAAREV